MKAAQLFVKALEAEGVSCIFERTIPKLAILAFLSRSSLLANPLIWARYLLEARLNIPFACFNKSSLLRLCRITGFGFSLSASAV